MLFKKFKISRKVRFKAIPLLVQGEAKRKYIKSRNSITSFDDFYEFLLMNYDVSSLLTNTSIPVQTDNRTEIVKKSMCVSKSTTDLKSNVGNTTASTQMSQSCVHCSNKTDLNDATKPNGKVSESKLIGSVTSTDNSSLDPMIIDLRKVIVADFIRNPKIFLCNKDDVTKWLDEIGHLMQTAHVPECNRLDLTSFSLRGDALQWYRNNKSMLTSWTVFVQEIKKAFKSSFCEEIAFKTLESYTQGQNQLVRNFYNEVLKLCKQADASMSESTKLKNLLNKVKPSIQHEVRKKTPKTTAEFLEYQKKLKNYFNCRISVQTQILVIILNQSLLLKMRIVPVSIPQLITKTLIIIFVLRLRETSVLIPYPIRILLIGIMCINLIQHKLLIRIIVFSQNSTLHQVINVLTIAIIISRRTHNNTKVLLNRIINQLLDQVMRFFRQFYRRTVMMFIVPSHQ